MTKQGYRALSVSAKQEWRDGWTVVTSCVLGMGTGAATFYSLGAFMAPLHTEFGWSRAQMATAISISSVVMGLSGPFLGHLVDRVGARRIALSGTIFVAAAFAALSGISGSIDSYWTHWGVVAIGLILTSPVVWTSAVVSRFNESRGLALSVALCGTNIAGVLAPLLATSLILRVGWRWAYVGVGAYMIASALPLATAFFYSARDLAKQKDKVADKISPTVPAPIETGLNLSGAMRTRRFWLIAVSFFFGGGSITGLLVHLIPMLEDRGLTPMVAASAASSMSVGAVVGRVSAGFFLDRLFAPRIAAASFAMPIVACIGLVLMPHNTTWPFISAILFGLALGAEYNLVSYLSARYFGLRSYGVIYGAMFGAFSVGQATMPAVIGKIYDIQGSYRIALIVLASAFLISASLLQFLGRYPDWNGGDTTTQSRAREPDDFGRPLPQPPAE